MSDEVLLLRKVGAFLMREKIKKPEVFLYATKAAESVPRSLWFDQKSHLHARIFIFNGKALGKHCLEGLKFEIYCYCVW
jgi:hypothetical protein